MHETALARQILVEVLARADGRTVRRIRGVVAEDEALSHDALSFHFRAHARDTPAESAELALELRRVSARCRGCGATFLPDHHLRVCPSCGQTDVELENEAGVWIESIDVEEP